MVAAWAAVRSVFDGKAPPERVPLNTSSADHLISSLKILPPAANGWISFEDTARLFDPLGDLGRLPILEILAAKCGFKAVVEPADQRIYFLRLSKLRASRRSGPI